MGSLYILPVNAKLVSIKFIWTVAVIEDNNMRCMYSLLAQLPEMFQINPRKINGMSKNQHMKINTLTFNLFYVYSSSHP